MKKTVAKRRAAVKKTVAKRRATVKKAVRRAPAKQGDPRR